MTSREVVEGLIAFAVQRFERANAPAGDLAEAWLAHVIASVRAARLLHDHGYGHEAAPLRRSILEHALWMRWVANHPDVAWATVRSKRRLAVQRNAEALGAWSPRQVQVLLEEEQVHVPTMKEIIAELAGNHPQLAEGTAHLWTRVYWSDSEYSHPSTTTAGELSETQDYDAALAVGLLLALGAYSSMLPGDPWEDPLAAAASDLRAAVPRPDREDD